MRALGRPNREQIVSMRPDHLTTLEAIDLSNGEPMAGMLKAGAGRLLEQVSNAREQVDWLFKRALARAPSPHEWEVLGSALGEPPTVQRVEDLFWVVLMLPEFQLIR